jgi:hypothetical protein
MKFKVWGISLYQANGQMVGIFLLHDPTST